MAYVAPPQVRQHIRDDTPEASSETMDAVQLFREVAADGFIAIRLKEAGARWGLFEQLERWDSQNLPVPSGKPQHPAEERELAVDRCVRRETSQMRLRRLPFGDVAQGEIGRDA